MPTDKGSDQQISRKQININLNEGYQILLNVLNNKVGELIKTHKQCFKDIQQYRNKLIRLPNNSKQLMQYIFQRQKYRLIQEMLFRNGKIKEIREDYQQKYQQIYPKVQQRTNKIQKNSSFNDKNSGCLKKISKQIIYSNRVYSAHQYAKQNSKQSKHQKLMEKHLSSKNIEQQNICIDKNFVIGQFITKNIVKSKSNQNHHHRYSFKEFAMQINSSMKKSVKQQHQQNKFLSKKNRRLKQQYSCHEQQSFNNKLGNFNSILSFQLAVQPPQQIFYHPKVKCWKNGYF